MHVEADFAGSEVDLAVGFELGDESFSNVACGHGEGLVHGDLTLEGDWVEAKSALLNIIIVQKIAIFSAPSSARGCHHANLSIS